jgi:hypothetical protein
MHAGNILFYSVYFQLLGYHHDPMCEWHNNCTLTGQFAKTLIEVTWHGLVLVYAFFECGFS